MKGLSFPCILPPIVANNSDGSVKFFFCLQYNSSATGLGLVLHIGLVLL